MRIKKVLVVLAGMVVFSFGFCVSAQEQVKDNIEILLKSDDAIDRNVTNYSMNFINEQVIRYPKVKQFFKDNNIKSFDDVIKNFRKIVEIIKTAKEESVVEKEAIMKDWNNYIKKQEFQNRYVKNKEGEIETKKNEIKDKKQMNVSSQEIEKLEKELKEIEKLKEDFNGEEFKRFSETKKQDIAKEISKVKSEVVILEEMLKNEALFIKGQTRFEEAFKKSSCSKENFSKNLENFINE